MAEKQNENVSGTTIKAMPTAARINVKTVAMGVVMHVMRNGNIVIIAQTNSQTE
ncbi:TPA: hypothetical protein I9Y36_003484 [Citrobacter amalonaticus]|nr:hypothetical protein [Citrobacter amalonaticus]